MFLLKATTENLAFPKTSVNGSGVLISNLSFVNNRNGGEVVLRN